jgi:hypothetical protein
MPAPPCCHAYAGGKRGPNTQAPPPLTHTRAHTTPRPSSRCSHAIPNSQQLDSASAMRRMLVCGGFEMELSPTLCVCVCVCVCVCHGVCVCVCMCVCVGLVRVIRVKYYHRLVYKSVSLRLFHLTLPQMDVQKQSSFQASIIIFAMSACTPLQITPHADANNPHESAPHDLASNSESLSADSLAMNVLMTQGLT